MQQQSTLVLLRAAVARVLEIERINYSTNNENADAEAAGDAETVELVAADAATWVFKKALASAEVARLEALNSAVRSLLAGTTPSKQQMLRLLTAQQYSEYTTSLNEPASSAEVMWADGMPDELRRYNLMLRQADFQYHKFEKMASLRRMGAAKFKQDSITRTQHNADVLYERALEYLFEQLEAPQNLHQRDELLRWLDRTVDGSAEKSPTLVPDEMPRVRGSRSAYAQDAALPKLSQRLKRQQRMLEHLLRASIDCAFEPEQVEVTQLTLPKRHLNVSPERDV